MRALTFSCLAKILCFCGSFFAVKKGRYRVLQRSICGNQKVYWLKFPSLKKYATILLWPHTNQPCLIEVYRDPATQSEKVIIVISLISGTTEVEFLLLGPGPGMIYSRVTYRCLQASFKIEQLIEKEIKSKKLPNCHPKIEHLKKSLENCSDC